MFNVGGPEIVVILLVALMILGPDQLPKAMRTFGNVMAEVRKVTGGIQAEIHKAMDSIDTSGPTTDRPSPASEPPASGATTEDEASTARAAG